MLKIFRPTSQTFGEDAYKIGKKTPTQAFGEILKRRNVMNNCETLESIREINLSYLMLAQRMLSEDRPTGMFRLGLSAKLADLLSGLTLAQTAKLAACDQLLCFFRFNDHAMLGALAVPARQPDVARTHAAVLLASQPAEQFA
jgi:flagellar transcriptional activator FlhD